MNSSIEGSERGLLKGGKEDKNGAAKETNECKRARQARKARWQAWWQILGLEKGMTWIFHSFDMGRMLTFHMLS